MKLSKATKILKNVGEKVSSKAKTVLSGADTKRLVNIKRVEEAYKNGALTEAEYLEKYKSLDSIHKQEKMAEQKKKFNLDDIKTEPAPAPKPAPQPQPDKIDVSPDDFKTRDEIEQIDASDILDINAEDLEVNNPEPKKFKSRAEEYADKLEEIDNRYNNGDISDIEYSDELNRLKDIYEKSNPVDASNVLNDSNKPAFDMDDFKNSPIDEIDIEKSLWRQAENKDNPTFNKKNTYNSNLSRESRIITNENDFNNELDTIEQLYSNGDLTDEQYANELNRTHRQYRPDLVEEANEETKQYIQDEIKSNQFNPKSDSLYMDINDRKSIIRKQGQGDYNANMTNGFVDSMTVNDETYNFKYREQDKIVDIYDSNNNLVTDKALYDDLISKGNAEVNSYYNNLSTEEWDTVIKNAEDYRFNNHTEGLESNNKLLNQNDAIVKRQEILKSQEKELQEKLKTEKSKKKRKDISDKRNNLGIEELEAKRLGQKNVNKLNARQEREAARQQFQNRVKNEGLQKGTAEYDEALKELKATFKNTNETMINKNKIMNKNIDAEIKGLQGKAMTLGKAVNIGLSAKAAVDKYKESRAEGKSAVSSAIRAGASAAVTEVLGPAGTVALMAAQVAPKAIVAGADALYKEHRRMNSASNFVPLGGVNFQDSQELATMRQSGMELAKMSQYNLEQSLMGAEAKHLHR